uniref:Tetraspanin 2b n=1 Tax=Astyanax mexicanus TaxID=7994 RepID=A0A3B1J0Z8_ASTMX
MMMVMILMMVKMMVVMGSLVLAVGLWLRLEQDTVALLGSDGAPENFFIGVYILIVAGGLVMLVGFFGCCGAVRESQCLLGSFFACLLIIFGAEVAAGVFGFLNKEKIIQDIQTFYSESAKDANGNNTLIVSSYHRVVIRITKTLLFIIYSQIIGMIFSMVLCCAVRNSREVI